jgi:hypothetical protein
MSLTTRALIGLAAGLAAGIAISLHPSPARTTESVTSIAF